MPDFRKVDPGDPLNISAAAWNASQDAARDYLSRSGGALASGPLMSSIRPTITVLVRNDTGGDLDYPGVLALGEPVLSAVDAAQDLQQTPGFAGTEPESETDAFAIIIESVAEDEFARGVVAGVAVCDVEVTDTAHEFATPTPGDATKLTSAASGPARILDREAGTGLKRATVLLAGGGADECCGFGSDYTTRYGWGGGLGFPNSQGSTGTIPTVRVIPQNGVSVAILSTMLRIPAGTDPVIVNGRISLQVSEVGTRSYAFTAQAQVAGRYVPAGGAPPDPWTANGVLVGWKDVCQGQVIDFATAAGYGGLRICTGDVTSNGNEFGVANIWAKSMNVGPYRVQQIPGFDLLLMWYVQHRMIVSDPFSSNRSWAIDVLNIGTGGTCLTYTKLCCEDDVSIPPQSSTGTQARPFLAPADSTILPPADTSTVSVTSQVATLAAGVTHYADTPASRSALYLSPLAEVGDRYTVVGRGAGGWDIAQRAGQTIRGGSSSTTTGTGGHLRGTQYGSAVIECVTAGTEFVVVNSTGTLTWV